MDFRLSDSIVNLVEGGFDIAIRDAALSDSTLIARKLAPDNRVLCASPEYISTFGMPTSPHDLANHQCINLIGLENWSFEYPDGPVSIKTRGTFRADNGEAVRDACAEGFGITLTSTWCSYKKLQRGELVRVLGDYPLVSNTAIWALYPSTRQLAPKVRAFIDYLSEVFGADPYWDQLP